MTSEEQQKIKPTLITSTLGKNSWESWSPTPYLRYVKKELESPIRWELRLQQMWQGSAGSQDWRWVEVVIDG